MAGPEAELVEPSAEPVGADRLAGLSAGEQPARGALVTECGVSVPERDEPADQGVEGFG